jgi:threonine/homoserine/homoserine lactone efflux protein
MPFDPHWLAVLGEIALLWLLVTIAPGPDFLLVTRLALTRGRKAAYGGALGIATGLIAWAAAGFFGIHALFVAAPWLYLVLKLGGGAYLCYLGAMALAGSFRRQGAGRHETGPARRRLNPFLLGVLNNLANPKAPIFTSSLFAATLPAHPPLALGLVAIAMMCLMCALWFVLVARCFTMPGPAAFFGRAKRWIDRVAGLAFMGFGTRLMLDRGA